MFTSFFRFIFASFLALFLFACTDEKDITTFYFPVKQLEQGKVYEYRFVGQPNLDPQYWYYQTLSADPKQSDKKGRMFTATLYNHKLEVEQIVSEEIVSNGMMLNDLYLYFYDSTGVVTRIQPRVESPSVYPFRVEDTTNIYLYKINFDYPDNPNHTTTIIKNRRFKGKTSYKYKEKSYECVEFELRELVQDNLNGRWENESVGKELYAKGIGLIYYKKKLSANFSQEYALSDIYEMSVLEQKLKK